VKDISLNSVDRKQQNAQLQNALKKDVRNWQDHDTLQTHKLEGRLFYVTEFPHPTPGRCLTGDSILERRGGADALDFRADTAAMY
jgi:hypothetical protein